MSSLSDVLLFQCENLPGAESGCYKLQLSTGLEVRILSIRLEVTMYKVNYLTIWFPFDPTHR